MSSKLILKGNIVFTPEFGKIKVLENSYVVVEGKYIKGLYKELPCEYKNESISDYTGKLIIPGFVDLHFHAPQLVNRGLGLDKELLPWLETYTFPEETKYSDLKYVKKAYEKVVYELWKNGTTRAVLFGTIHKEGTIILMELLDKAGLGAYVGKVNMDRNAPDFYVEETEESLLKTKEFIEETIDKYDLVKPIITPRFVPTCTLKLMKGLGELAKKYKVKIQSHLSENKGEIEWVKNLHPEFKNYSEVYNHCGLFGQQPTVMAHCIWNTPEEIELMVKNKIWVAHSPNSNVNLSSGIAPIRKYIEKGIRVGIATDISGGHDVSITKAIVTASQINKLRWVYMAQEEKILSIIEWFYLATKGGGEFFGKVGSFETGYEFDALVIDDESISDLNNRTVEERLERYIYIGDDRNILKRYIAGKLIEKPKFN